MVDLDSNKKVIKFFRAKMVREMRTFKWFHKTYLKDITYSYFIVQVNDPDRLHESVKKAMQKYLK